MYIEQKDQIDLHWLNRRSSLPEIGLWELFQVEGFVSEWRYMQVSLSWEHLTCQYQIFYAVL